MTEVEAILIVGSGLGLLICVNMFLCGIVLKGVLWQLKLTEKSLHVTVATTKVLLDILRKADKDADNDND